MSVKESDSAIVACSFCGSLAHACFTLWRVARNDSLCRSTSYGYYGVVLGPSEYVAPCSL